MKPQRQHRGAILVAIVITVVLAAAVAIISSVTAPPRSSDASGSSPAPRPTAGAQAAQRNLCGGALTTTTTEPSGLYFAVTFPAASTAGAKVVTGTATLTNGGSTRVTGFTGASPIITVSQNGRVLWHTNGAMIALAAAVDLAPGASMTYPAAFTPVRCAATDESSEFGFRDGLPPLSPGEYDVSAAIDLSRDGTSVVIGGPTATVRLR